MFPIEWTCTAIDASSTKCIVDVVSTSTEATTTATTSTSTIREYDGPNFQEFLFIAGIIIFILSYPLWPRIFLPIKKIFDK